MYGAPPGAGYGGGFLVEMKRREASSAIESHGGCHPARGGCHVTLEFDSFVAAQARYDPP